MVLRALLLVVCLGAAPAGAQALQPAGTGPDIRGDATAREVRNAARIRAHHDAINRGDVAEAAGFYAERFTNNGNAIDRARLQAIIADNAATFPDWTMRIDRLVARGDDVVALITVTGTHRGTSRRPVNGGTYLNVPPTGRRFSVLHTHWFTLKDDLIVEHRATRDDLGMARQLGLLPPAPPRVPDETPR
jgi:predicted ester cyclase